MKTMTRQLLALFAMTVLLGGCAGVPKQSFDRQSQSALRTIAVLQPAIPLNTNVWLAVDPGQNFGLVGALVSAGVQSGRVDRYMTVVKAAQFDQRNYFTLQLVAALKAAGYSPRFLDVPRDREKPAFIESYPDAPAGVDAYLDTYSAGLGYMAAGAGSSLPYRPTAYFGARLVSATSDHAVLFSDEVFYNPGGPAKQDGITLAAQPGHEYSSSDALVAAGPESLVGLKQALDAVAAEIVRQLR